VKAVYIRQTGNKKEKVTKVLENLETLDISVCYFKNSAQADFTSEEGRFNFLKKVIHCKDAIAQMGEILYKPLYFS
jgi:hypothetical protein